MLEKVIWNVQTNKTKTKNQKELDVWEDVSLVSNEFTMNVFLSGKLFCCSKVKAISCRIIWKLITFTHFYLCVCVCVSTRVRWSEFALFLKNSIISWVFLLTDIIMLKNIFIAFYFKVSQKWKSKYLANGNGTVR